MLFNSIEFLIFCTVTYLLYRLSPFRLQNTILLVGSYIFYGWWDVRLLFLIVASTAIDYCCGALIDTGRISRFDRQLASATVILAALFFDTLRWNALKSSDWTALLPRSASDYSIFFVTLILVGGSNLLYPRFVKLDEQPRRKLFLIVSIVTNLAILGFFKYFNFFIGSAGAIARAIGIPVETLHLNLVLPVGISFYTFKAISYAVDVYKGKLHSEPHFWDFALFWAYFPPLFAGPIDRAAHLLPQITQPRRIRFGQSIDGFVLILLGLFKKTVISDGIATSVNAVYTTTGSVSWLDVVAATVLYAVQIYCDFSGYSDIARGVSKLFGIELALNFNFPYFSKTPSEFWQRWHISLSTWLRDYLYIPLGGNRQGTLKTYRNLMLTMLLGGLWHGAAWNFVLWGAYQGALLCSYRLWDQASKEKHPQALWQRIAATIGFFALTCYGWLLFRATSLDQIIHFTRLLVTDFGNFTLTMPKLPLATMIGLPLLIGYEALAYRLGELTVFDRVPMLVRAAFFAVMIFVLSMGFSNASAQFIYLQF